MAGAPRKGGLCQWDSDGLTVDRAVPLCGVGEVAPGGVHIGSFWSQGSLTGLAVMGDDASNFTCDIVRLSGEFVTAAPANAGAVRIHRQVR